MKNIIAIVLTIILYFSWSNLNKPNTNLEIRSDYSNADVILYSTAWCGYCTKTRHFLNDNNIPFSEYDIERSDKGSRDYKRYHGRGVPLMVVNGSIIHGYNINSLVQALNEQE